MRLLTMTAAFLRERGTPFALIGAAAMAVHGVSRSTRDLDLLVVGPDRLAPSFWEPLQAGGVEARVERGGADDPLAGVVRLRLGEEAPLDVVVGRSGWQADVVARAGLADVEGGSVPVVRRADLVLLKLYAGGPQDAWDIEQLLEVPERPALVAEVERGLAALPEEARRLWARVRGSTDSMT